MTMTLLRPGALAGRTVVAEGAIAVACADGGATIVTPGATRVDTLVAFLASAGGECFSGCRFSLRRAGAGSEPGLRSS